MQGRIDWLRPLRAGARVARRLGRARGFAVAVVFCLGLGLGAVAQIASVVDAYLLRPLPFRDPDRLLLIWKTFDNEQARGLQYFLNPKDFLMLREEVRSLEVAGQQPRDLDVVAIGEAIADAERVSGARVTGNFFSFFGIRATAGRPLQPSDERLESPVAIVSEGFAERHYGGPSALGKRIGVDGRTHEIVGLVVPGEGYPTSAELWVPLTRAEYEGRFGIQTLGRIDDGTTRVGALEEIRALGSRLREIDPDANSNAGLEAEHLQSNLVGDMRVTLAALALTVVLLLAIAIANTACLVLARAQRRAGEQALQRMLGAPRWRLFLETLAESGLLALGGAVLGVAVASLALPALLAVSPVEAFTYAPIRLDARVVLLVGAVAAAIAILFAALASFAGRATQRRLDGSRRTIRTPRSLSALVILDVALTTVLLVGAAALLETVYRMTRADPGFDPEQLVTVGVSASSAWASEHSRRVAFFARVVEEAERLPGVASAAAVNKLPMTDPEYHWGFNVEGRPPADPGATDTVLFRLVTSGYFRTLRQPLLTGRTLTASDDEEAQSVVLANHTFAERYFGGDDEALGKRLKGGRYSSGRDWVTIVGVVGDTREHGLSRAVGPALFFPMAQWDRMFLSRMSVVLRQAQGAHVGASPVPALRAAIREIDREAVLFDVEPMGSIVARSLRRQRFAMTILLLFGALALVQAAAGLYGVLSYSVASGRREIGLRMALGARPREVRRWVLRRGAVRSALGLVAGLLGASALSRWARSAWAEVEPADLATYLAVATLTATVALLATYLPARRAAAIDPARTLQEE